MVSINKFSISKPSIRTGLRSINNASMTKTLNKIVYSKNGNIRDRFALSAGCKNTALHLKGMLERNLKLGKSDLSSYSVSLIEKSEELKINLFNIICTLPGTPPSKGKIIIGAHYDTIFDIKDSAGIKIDKLLPGADDNASGVAVMLELSKIFGSKSAPKIPFDLEFVAFTAEEIKPLVESLGLVGSDVYIRYILSQYNKPVLGAYIIDMVGYNPFGNHVDVVVYKRSKDFGLSLLETAKKHKLNISTNLKLFNKNKSTDMDDLKYFGRINIPSCLLTESFNRKASPLYPGNPYYHTRKDTISTLNIEQTILITKLIFLDILKKAGSLKA